MPQKSYTRVSAVPMPGTGRILVAGACASSVDLLDATEHRLLLTYAGHRADVLAVALSPDGKRALSVGRDEAVHLWDATSGRRRLVYPDHTVLIPAREAVRVLPGPDGQDHWHRPTPAVGRSTWIRHIAWSHDGTHIATLEDFSRTAHIWQASNGRQVARACGSAEHVKALAWSPDGSRLVVASAYDHVVQVWDVEAGASVYEKTWRDVCQVFWVSAERVAMVSRSAGVRVRGLA